MMYQLGGSQTEDKNPAKPFLGKFAEYIIAGIKEGRQVPKGNSALLGEEEMDIKSRKEYYT